MRVFQSTNINIVDSIKLNEKSCDLFLEKKSPLTKNLRIIYFYTLPKAQWHGVKIGMTTCHPNETIWDAIRKRIEKQVTELALSEEQYQKFGDEREVIHWGVALDSKSEEFKDYYVHDAIKRAEPKIVVQDQEWFTNIEPDRLISIFESCRNKNVSKELYTPRKEQRECIDALRKYFEDHPIGGRFLLNCKMRFGKSFATYKYCEEAGLDKVLILTFVPAVEDSWREDLEHIKKEYDYFTDADLRKDSFLPNFLSKPFVLFLSLQNYLGKTEDKQVKEKIRKLQDIPFDLVVLDEYHFGAWNERTQDTIVEDIDQNYQKELLKAHGLKVLDKFHIQTERTICLSGTPYKAIAKGEFTAENTFTYSYFDEQENKYPDPEHPLVVDPAYEKFPDMKIFGYNMAELFPDMALTCVSGDKILKRNYFSLNQFFRTEKDENGERPAKFVNEDPVRYWLDILKGRSARGENYPFVHPRMLPSVKDSLWLLPTIHSCKALSDLLEKDDFFKRYEIINLSDPDVGAGKKALDYLHLRMRAAEQSIPPKLGTIAITVNKLTVGVTVKPWSSVFVLKDLTSPESYFQSIFRIQTPYVKQDGSFKKEGFVFDFNIDRAASLLLKYAENSEGSGKVEKMKIASLIVRHLPIYMNGDMDHPISKEVFYQLAQFGDTSGEPLSKKIADTRRTTRILDDETIAEMLNDPKVHDIIKKVFAHSKFQKAKTRTPPSLPDDDFIKRETDEGRKIGYEKGIADSGKYVDYDDKDIQDAFDKNIQEYLTQCCPKDYDEIREKCFKNGFCRGYERGVNAPIRKLNCGKEDGIQFVERVKERFGKDIVYVERTRRDIENFVRHHLNDIQNIPEQYRHSLYRRWYCDSFQRALRSSLRPKVRLEEGESIEDADNVLRHILSRLFEFLYISVYRETTFREIFKNADPKVFLEAVGISKEDFEALNKYKIFEERTLDNYIKEFFVNEELGKNTMAMSGEEKGKYRNSFDWFGYGIKDER